MQEKKIQILILMGLVLSMLVGYSIFCFSDTLAATKILYWGSSNSEVKLAQWKLNQWGYYDGRVDGVYGTDTAIAVKNFQRRNGLQVDGVIGKETWNALGFPFKPRISEYGTPELRVAFANSSVNRYDNVELLARLIHAEAGGEPYEGQVAVGAVLLNRVESPSFPNTLSSVIYQPMAFESVTNGQFNLPPDEENFKAASAAINGWDPTYGSLFFWNPSKPVNRWIWSRTTVRTIGHHIFAK